MTLLRHTTAGATERHALTINPAKTCQPVGAMYAALGIHRCLPHSHGSQGCCSYHRSALTRHYKEPVMAATSSFTEGSAVFGGQSNLLQALDTIFATYDPDVVAVHTTCLSETIGDDLPQIIGKARDEGHIPAGKHVIHANTPSYVGSHVVGFSNMVRSMVQYLVSPSTRRSRRLNIIPGWVEPADMREIKRIAAMIGVEVTLFPDTSRVLETPMTGRFEFYPPGGTTLDALASAGANQGTLALGPSASAPAATAMTTKCKTPSEVLELPIGISATDRFVNQLHRTGLVDVPAALEEERGRLLDLMSDTHQYLHGRRVALFGDPDQLVALSEFLCDLDAKPVYILTGTPEKDFEARVTAALRGRVPDVKIKAGACTDLFLLHEWIKSEPVDLLIGNSYGKYIARDEGIPFVRHGFPVVDRIGHQFFPTVGYAGAVRLMEKMLDAVLDKKDRECPEEGFELVM